MSGLVGGFENKKREVGERRRAFDSPLFTGTSFTCISQASLGPPKGRTARREPAWLLPPFIQPQGTSVVLLEALENTTTALR